MGARIVVRNNGSLKVEGDFELVDEQGNRYDLAGRTRISLCRCGHSSKKPFCDHAHRAAGFESHCEAYALEPIKPS